MALEPGGRVVVSQQTDGSTSLTGEPLPYHAFMPGRFEQSMRDQIKDLATRLNLSEDRAFMVWYGIHALQLEEVEAVEAASYDGGNDRGIDFFLVDDAPERVVIAQSKYLRRSDRNPKPEELALLLRVLDELEDPQGLRDAGRSDLAEAADDLADAMLRGYSVELQLVYPGKASTELDRMIRQFNRKKGRDSEGVVASIVRLADLQVVYEDSLGLAGQVGQGELELLDGKYMKQDGPYGTGLVFSVRGSELKRLYEEHGNKLFDQNIRLFLGTRKGTVNAGIRDTLASGQERGNFWAYNNGLTIVAGDFELSDSAVQLENFSIVNGCQTTVSLAKAEDAAAEKASVLVRVVAAKKNLVDNIIRYTNSQTPINVWDLSARDKLQQRLRQELAELPEPWFYALRRGDFDAVKDKELFGPYGSRRVIPHPLGAQYLAALRGLPVEAYKDRGRLFTAHKDRVFPKETNGSDLLWAWAVGSAAESAIEEYRQDAHEDVVAIIRRGARFFATAVAAQLLRFRNGDDVFAKVDTTRLQQKAMKDRLHKYAIVAVLYYVGIMRNLIDAGQDLSVLLRNRETATMIDRRVQDRLIEEKLAPRALDEKLPLLPGISKG